MNLVINIWIVVDAVESSTILLIYGFKESRCGLWKVQDIYSFSSPIISTAVDDYDEGMMIHLQKNYKKNSIVCISRFCWVSVDDIFCIRWYFFICVNRAPTFGLCVYLYIFWECFALKIQDNLFIRLLEVSEAWKFLIYFFSLKLWIIFITFGTFINFGYFIFKKRYLKSWR